MKRFFTIGLLVLLLLPSIATAATVKKTSKAKKKIEKWCNEKWFRDNGYFDTYGENLKIIGVEKLKIGTLKPRWTCHWKTEKGPLDRLSYEWWWTVNVGKGPLREKEYHWRTDGTLGDATYRDDWEKIDKKTKKKESCTFFSLSGETYCF